MFFPSVFKAQDSHLRHMFSSFNITSEPSTSYYYPPFTDEDCKAEEVLSISPKITRLTSDRARIPTRPLGPVAWRDCIGPAPNKVGLRWSPSNAGRPAA